MEKNTYQNNNILYLITGLYCLALILFLAVWGYTPTNDGDGYIEFAQICIKNKQLYPCMALIQGHPFIWNIGSINLTALSLLLFNSLYPLLVLLCIMKAITAFLIGKISQKLFSDRIGAALFPKNIGKRKIYIQKNNRKLKSIDDSAKLEKFMRREEEKAQRIKEREERIQNKEKERALKKEEIKKQLEAIKKNREIIEEEHKKYIEDRKREKEDKKLKNKEKLKERIEKRLKLREERKKKKHKRKNDND